MSNNTKLPNRCRYFSGGYLFPISEELYWKIFRSKPISEWHVSSTYTNPRGDDGLSSRPQIFTGWFVKDGISLCIHDFGERGTEKYFVLQERKCWIEWEDKGNE